MNFKDLLRLVWGNLNRMRGRVIMTAMGVVIGTTAIVVLLALSTGLRDSTVNNFEQFGGLNQITVMSGGMMGSSTDEVLDADALEELAALDGVIGITPNQSVSGGSLTYNRDAGFGTVYGIDPDITELLGFEYTEGSAKLGSNRVVIGAKIAQSFVEDSSSTSRNPFMSSSDDSEEEIDESEIPDLYGKTIMLTVNRNGEDGREERTIRINVVGILEETGGNDDYYIYMSIDDVESISNWQNDGPVNWDRNGYNQILVIAEEDTETTLAVSETINDLGYFAISTSTVIEGLNSTFVIIEAVLAGVASIALLVAAIGIANTMVMSVLERTREIGLMKAVGARNNDVMTVFLTEASAIGLLGGVAGFILGWLITLLLDLILVSVLASSDTSISLRIPGWLPFFAIIFSMIIGLAAGIYPAFRAVQLDPVKALKYE